MPLSRSHFQSSGFESGLERLPTLEVAVADELTNRDEKTDALIAADKLLDRLKGEAFAGIKPGADEGEALGEIVEELETAPEIDQVQAEIGRPRPDPTKIGPGLQKLIDDNPGDQTEER
jgi:hypothetical protein